MQNSWDNSKLQVLVSLDCGNSWNEASVLVGGNLSTVSGADSGAFLSIIYRLANSYS